MNNSALLKVSQVVVPLAIFAFMIWYAAHSDDLHRIWLVTALLLLFFCGVIGQWLMDSPTGILISNLNLISLSRIQLVAWTIVIFSSYFVIVMFRIHKGFSAIGIPDNLLAALGISTASFATVPVVLDSKTRSTVDPKAIRTASLVLKENAGTIQQNSKGALYANSHPSDARFSDLFQGDEIGNTAYVDISKLQLFLLTLFVIVAYCCDVWSTFAKVTPNSISSLALPDFSFEELKLLGLSHAGYLTFKAMNHTPDAPAASQN